MENNAALPKYKNKHVYNVSALLERMEKDNKPTNHKIFYFMKGATGQLDDSQIDELIKIVKEETDKFIDKLETSKLTNKD